MKKLTADLIFDGTEFHKDSAVVCNENGIILDLIKITPDDEHVERHKGILTPGFINAHCHLELSHLKGLIPQHEGLDQFIRSIEHSRNASEETIISNAQAADEEMRANGIVAIGDISNTPLTFRIKKQSRNRYYTFVEVFAFHPDRAETAIDKGKALYRILKDEKLDGSITPHAPYSASSKLLKKISEAVYSDGAPLTIHMEESPDEDLLFIHKEGKILERLRSFGIDDTFFTPTGFSALRSSLIHLPTCNSIQLVHNTCTSREDIEWAEAYHSQLYWCFCPKANLYIENKVPDFSMFFKAGVKCTIGTDSLASNNSLDVLDELKAIVTHAPEIPLEWLLSAATRNGADFLGMHELGRFEKGKKPGINLLTGIDADARKLSPGARVTRLL